jgi:hypothetical protein
MTNKIKEQFIPFLSDAETAYRKMLFRQGRSYKPTFCYYNPVMMKYPPGTIPDVLTNGIPVFVTTKIEPSIFVFTESPAFNNVAPPSRSLVDFNPSMGGYSFESNAFNNPQPLQFWGEKE